MPKNIKENVNMDKTKAINVSLPCFDVKSIVIWSNNTFKIVSILLI